MNFAGNFKYIGNVDATTLIQLVAQLTEEQWNNELFRQKEYAVHEDTQTIGLVFDRDFRHSHPTRMPALQVFEKALGPVLSIVADHYENSNEGQSLIQEFGLGYFVRASLVRLIAGGEIPKHRDHYFSLSHSHRVHVPVTTNDEVAFRVGKETINMRPGELIEINNRRPHSVSNNGDDGRVHLILDFVLPGEKCCCGPKLHPNTLCSPQACADTLQRRIPCTCFPED
jgi:quercetin dioxygenase-like cupin family protein